MMSDASVDSSRAARLHQLSVEQALESLRSSTSGITRAESARRLREFGPNRLQEARHLPLWRRLVAQVTSFLSLLLWAAAALAFIVQWTDPTQDMARVGGALVAVIFVSGVFSYWQEARAERSLEALRQLLPEQITALRENTAGRLPAEQLVPGDVILLEAGDRVPADCRLIESFGMRVDNSALTGESVPKPVAAEPSNEVDLRHSRNLLFAGSVVVSGRAKAVVFATGGHTEFGRIAHLVQTTAEEPSPLQREVQHLSRWIAIASLVAGIALFAISRALGVHGSHAAVFAIAVLVAMVPEGLLPTLTLALVLATQRMAVRRVLIRHLPAVEALGSTTVICTDKTGTLTQNRMTVREVLLGDKRYAVAELPARSQVLEHYRPFLLTARLCQNLQTQETGATTRLAGDAMELALVEMGKRLLSEEFVALHGKRIEEKPLDADRMRVSVVYSTPNGATLYCKGAPELVLALCQHVLVDGEVRPLSDELRVRVIAIQNDLASHGLRVLGLAYRPLQTGFDRAHLEEDLVWAGLAALEDPPRPEVPDAIRRCREAGIQVIMVTGDHPLTATAIAREIGLVQSAAALVITGVELARLSATQLQLALDAPDILFARVAADQKMRIVEALKAKRHVVAATGDGVNDAPALKAAHVGIAMGLSGTDVAKQAADMVLLDDNFASIVSAVEEGRAVFENVRKFLTYILAHNVPELVPSLAFMLFKVPLALTPIQILSVDMGTDSLTALGLGSEPPDERLMRQPPRPRDERLVDWRLALRAYAFLGAIEAAAAMAAFFFVLFWGGWRYGQTLAESSLLYRQATTATLATIIVMQIVNVYLCRSRSHSLLTTGLRGNRLITAGVVLEVLLLLLIGYTPWGQLIFNTAPVPSAAWLLILPFAVALLALEELRKALVRNRATRASRRG